VNDQEDDDDSGDDERDGPDDADVDENGSVDTEPCRHCKRQISEYAEVCPYCGNYVSREELTERKSVWIVIGAAILLVVILVSWVMTKPQP
jgi:hypothetical protein